MRKLPVKNPENQGFTVLDLTHIVITIVLLLSLPVIDKKTCLNNKIVKILSESFSSYYQWIHCKF